MIFHSVKSDGLEMVSLVDQIGIWMVGQITIWDVATKSVGRITALIRPTLDKKMLIMIKLVWIGF